MDLNQLLYHHQIAIMRASGQCGEQADVKCLVEHYRRRIRDSFVAADASASRSAVWLKTTP